MEHAPRDVELLSVSKQEFDGCYVLGYHLDNLPDMHRERAGAITTSLLVSNIDMKQSVTDLKESVADLKQIVADMKQNNDNLKKDNDDLKQQIFGLKEHVHDMPSAPRAIEGPQAVVSPDSDVLNALQANWTEFQVDVESRVNKLEQTVDGQGQLPPVLARGIVGTTGKEFQNVRRPSIPSRTFY